MLALIRYCYRNKNLNDLMEITPLCHKALYVHLSYFCVCPFLIQVFPDFLELDLIVGATQDPFPQTNYVYMLACLASCDFFVSSMPLYSIVALQGASVRRSVMLIPIGQLAWNIRNNFVWLFFADSFSPQGPILFTYFDIAIIWPIAAIYAHHFFTAKLVQPDKQKES